MINKVVMKLVIMISVMFALNIFNGLAQGAKDNLFEKLKAQYSNLESISLNFTLNENKAVNGQLLAKKGNKYVLSIANRKITCDGNTIWNYVPENKNVLISKFESHNESASIEKIFFEFTKNFKANNLYEPEEDNINSNMMLELVPVGEDGNDITMVRLVLNPGNLSIKRIVIIRNYAEESWNITNLKLNSQVADNKFVFKAPEGVEIIDLR
ncbi:MAG: outer membrane lipoprotein carrier protein LolA [Candidatus Kapabacteria bacterium]|jgi:outer membrane lipoprotein carrier protein|nr:outer membrane lipoprotein carrier protein LolA [Candidatus Kapabacteria bacterium]